VTPSGIARRYAGALFDVVQRTGQIDRAGRELAEFSQAVSAHPDLKKAFDTPAVPAKKKRAIVEAVLAAAPGISPEVSRLLVMLAEQDRLMLLDEVNEAYAARLRAVQRVVPAEIVTATPLPDGRRAALAKALGSAMGLDVDMTERVDPALIGGVVARVGGTVFDGSVARQLERLRQKLLAEA
jgi:F-type H+-transporting ATPase subunit delta